MISKKNDFKILLISPVPNSILILENVGICSIASYLRHHGYEVKLIAVMEKDLNYQEILDYEPDLIGITIYNETMELVFSLCNVIKDKIPKTKICVGGFAATFYTNEIFEHCSHIDYIISGEGEGPFLELADRCRDNDSTTSINGLAYRDGSQIIVNDNGDYIADLDKLPFISREVLQQYSIPYPIISTSRGCVKKCDFCCSHDFWKKNKKIWRGRSPEHVVEEIALLHNKFNLKQFWISDASFEDPGFNRSRMKKIAETIIEKQLHIIYFVYVRPDFYKKADAELMQLLAKSGLCMVFVGGEAYNNADLKVYGKEGIVSDDVQNTVDFFKQFNISTDLGFINFNPYSTFTSLRENAAFFYRMNLYSGSFQFSRLRLYKGCKLYNVLQEDNLLDLKTFYDTYGYRYVDKRVETLVNFLIRFEEKADEKSFILSELYSLATVDKNRLIYFKRLFCSDQESKISQIVSAHEERQLKIIEDFNEQAHKWYTNLLTLAETNWSLEEAHTITENYMNEELLTTIVTSLKKEKIIFHKKIGKVNIDYMSYL